MIAHEQVAIQGDNERLIELTEQEVGMPPGVPNKSFRFNPLPSDKERISPREDASIDLVARDSCNAQIHALKHQNTDFTAQITVLNQITWLTQMDRFIPINSITSRKLQI